ncbi:MAG: SGNH/GDSL hydrolase family protein, partial [Oscillospiraceae bacterium]|nr:SGNH/GDSL hydrolase family protein [Oscillospiraceae bacterium]
VTYTSPEYVCIMLGSNGIQFISIDKLINCTDTLVKTILELAPDAEIVILSVPPVTPGYDATVPNMDVQHQMDCYNASLEGYCRQGGYTYVDIATPLKDDTGYFDPDYAANDGMHFKAEAYRIMLDTVYTKLYNEKLEKLKNGELTETETETETQISETEITDASVTEVPESETVPSETTVPESVTVTETSETTVPASSVTTPETSKTTAPAKEKTPAATTAPKTKPAETTVPGTSSDSEKTEQTTGKSSKKKKKRSTVTTAAGETSAAQTETSNAKKKKSK